MMTRRSFLKGAALVGFALPPFLRFGQAGADPVLAFVFFRSYSDHSDIPDNGTFDISTHGNRVESVISLAGVTQTKTYTVCVEVFQMDAFGQFSISIADTEYQRQLIAGQVGPIAKWWEAFHDNGTYRYVAELMDGPTVVNSITRTFTVVGGPK